LSRASTCASSSNSRTASWRGHGLTLVVRKVCNRQERELSLDLLCRKHPTNLRFGFSRVGIKDQPLQARLVRAFFWVCRSWA
jgi:hypothetical protein